jgi:hypothetical protein
MNKIQKLFVPVGRGGEVSSNFREAMQLTFKNCTFFTTNMLCVVQKILYCAPQHCLITLHPSVDSKVLR